LLPLKANENASNKFIEIKNGSKRDEEEVLEAS